jgi:hypothetical protein
MVGMGIKAIRDEHIVIRSQDTLNELFSYEQVNESGSGKKLRQPKYQGAAGAHDDRVIILIMACYVVFSFPLEEFFVAPMGAYDRLEGVSEDHARIYQNSLAARGGDSVLKP